MTDPIVIDCNVLVSALVSRAADSAPAQVLRIARQGHVEFLLSVDLVEEYRTVLHRPKLRARHLKEPREIEWLLAELVGRATMVQPLDHIPEGPDPGDAHLWRLLRMHPDAILITGDRDLIVLPPAWARVMTPRDWLADNVALTSE